MFNKKIIFDTCKPDIAKRSKWVVERANKGYCEYDSYCIDRWFLDTIPGLLDIAREKMKNRVHESFIKIYLGEHSDTLMTYEHYKHDADYKKRKEIEGICINEYQKILDEMSNCFKEANPETCSLKNRFQKEHDIFSKELFAISNVIGSKNEPKDYDGPKRISECLDKHCETIRNYAEEHEKIIVYQKKNRERGFELFVKYFDDLGWQAWIEKPIHR